MTRRHQFPGLHHLFHQVVIDKRTLLQRSRHDFFLLADTAIIARRMISWSLLLGFRVRYPLVGTPTGTGWRHQNSDPHHAHRMVYGFIPHANVGTASQPALTPPCPRQVLVSILPTDQSLPDTRREPCASHQTATQGGAAAFLAINCAPEPAERASCPPLPTFISTL